MLEATSEEIVVTGGAQLKAFQSSETGLRAVLIKTSEPICRVYVAIATEAETNEWSHKDDGCHLLLSAHTPFAQSRTWLHCLHSHSFW